MLRAFRLFGFLSVLSLTCGVPLQSEDLNLRMQAVHLMEMANAASLAGGLRNYRQTVSFVAYDRVTGAPKSGTFTRLSAGSAGHRDEINFGDYHSIRATAGNRVSATETSPEPAEVRELFSQLPIRLGRFDHEDIIRSIEDSAVLGRSARCINFDTQFGDTLQANQICVDSERAALLRWRVGEELVENSEFFQIRNLWEPGHIRLFERGALRLEIEQQIVSAEVDPASFVPPNGRWNTMFPCRNPRRPVAVFTPMPPAGDSGTGIVDVVAHGYIWSNGKVQPTGIESSLRPDLNDEALRLVATWRFLPLICNDEPATTDSDFVVHFQNR